VSRGRKGERRQVSTKPKADDEADLAELAAVLSEYTLDNNAAGWFRPAWRDGWNAVELAIAACTDDEIDEYDAPALAFARGACMWRKPFPDSQAWRSTNLYEAASDHWATANDQMLRAALRCLQVMIANSDGGGEVYNAILLSPFAGRLPEDVFDLVLEHRCRDSIGTTAQLQGDAHDRLRRAFATAWKRGLYVAAYAIKPAVEALQIQLGTKTVNGKLTVWKDSRRG